MALTQPTKSSREWEKKHAGHVAQFKALARKRGIEVREVIHTDAFEKGARAKLAEAGK